MRGIPSAVGLPKKDEQPANEPDFDISSVEQYLADVTHTGRISRSSKIEVRIEAIKRQIFKLYRKKRR